MYDGGEKIALLAGHMYLSATCCSLFLVWSDMKEGLKGNAQCVSWRLQSRPACELDVIKI